MTIRVNAYEFHSALTCYRSPKWDPFQKRATKKSLRLQPKEGLNLPLLEKIEQDD
jgi:hypothetical protein